MKKKIVAIMMYGYPATGKTFIAKKLVSSLKNNHKIAGIATLDIRKKLNLFNLESDEQRNLVYDSLANNVKDVISNKKEDIIIIDGNFNKRRRRDRVYSVLKDAAIYVIKCVVSDEEIISKRMEERRKNIHIHENKAATMQLYNMIKETSDNIEKDELVKKEIINLIQFNSQNNVIEKIILSKDNNTPEITKDILSILEDRK